MKTYHFDISGEVRPTLEVVEAADDASAARQALLLLSEILRDRALSADAGVALRIVVRDDRGRTIWDGAASGRL
ncbi:hypothetical protein [Caulobacter sp. UNC358MFTsu5.1]|uniref:DUF6894 family protein n=1 Tax=Caulobacter sp. UNC358MFTsu5.1 TaxID=1449049 RepID=UPI0004A6F3A5|nr:hypothetical protein [Caulobacter sp. UNC358MFTsu5.1]